MTTTKARRPKTPQAPISRQRSAKRPFWVYAVSAAGIVAAGTLFLVFGRASSGGHAGGAGLPSTSDYHSLLVSPSDPDLILLGTHQGVFRSTDGGRHWASYRLEGQDAMNLVRAKGGATTWMAGHDVLAKSTDGARTWQRLAPTTLPSLDLHGFAVDPRNPRRLWAAVAGVGLFRSDDGGTSFHQASRAVGGNVLALTVAPDGQLFAGDGQRGLLASRDGGRSWREALNAQLAGISLNPTQPRLILATGPGVLRSTDAGKTWSQVLRIDAGAGPVAWSPSNPKLAYVVGFDRSFYRSSDAGRTWTKIGG